MFDLEKQLALAKSRTERLRKSQRASESLLEDKSRELYTANQKLEEAQKNLEGDIKQATYELKVANGRLRKSLDEKSRLISSISHEIRTPLNAIIGLSELVEKNLDPGENKKHLATIYQSATSMLALLNEILEAMHIEIGQAQLKLSVENLPDNLQFIRDMFALQIKEKGLSWIVSDYSGPKTLKLDIRRYNQVINNLISNAVKNTIEGKICLSVTYVKDKKPEHGVLVTTISDTGVGIDESHQASIFDLYSQLSKPHHRDAKGNIQSVGLGLPICKKICELMMGSISCSSLEGEGSEFSFSVPVMVADEEQPLPDKTQEPLSPLRILIAEDNIVNQEVIRSQLDYLNQDVEIVDNGKLALEKLKESDYDIVFLDIMMPELDGKETLQLIRASEPRIAQHFCVALTAASYKEQGEYLLSLGFDKFMSKPVNIQQVSEILSEVNTRANKANKHNEEILFSLRRDMGDRFPEFFAKLVPTYIEESQNKIQQLEGAVKSQDVKQIKFLSHSLKGEARTFELKNLSLMCEALEKSVNSKNIQKHYAKIHDEWLIKVSQMEQELEEIISKQQG